MCVLVDISGLNSSMVRVDFLSPVTNIFFFVTDNRDDALPLKKENIEDRIMYNKSI